VGVAEGLPEGEAQAVSVGVPRGEGEEEGEGLARGEAEGGALLPPLPLLRALPLGAAAVREGPPGVGVPLWVAEGSGVPVGNAREPLALSEGVAPPRGEGEGAPLWDAPALPLPLPLALALREPLPLALALALPLPLPLGEGEPKGEGEALGESDAARESAADAEDSPRKEAEGRLGVGVAACEAEGGAVEVVEGDTSAGEGVDEALPSPASAAFGEVLGVGV
jgi:hypothetical protein